MKSALGFSSGLMAVLFFSVLCSAEVGAKDSADWTLTPSLGILWGMAHEIVYDTSGIENQNDYLSLLSWELKPVVMIGFEALRESPRNDILSLSLRSAIPGLPSGEMNDYDWLYTDRDWSHWSVSDIWIRWGFILDAEHQWALVKRRPITMRLGVAYHLDWWAWRDITRDSVYSNLAVHSSYYPAPFGYYGADGFRDRPDWLAVGVSGIDYSVAYHVLMAVFSFEWTGKALFLNGTGRIGPTLAFSHDHHKLRGIHFYDHAFGGPWVDLALEAGFRSNGRFSFSLRGEYAWLAETRGNSIYVFTDGSPKQLSKDSAGFSFHRIAVSALFSWAVGSRP